MSSGKVQGKVRRFMPDCLSVTARAGLMLKARTNSVANNAVFRPYPRGLRVVRDRCSGIDVVGRILTNEGASQLRLPLPGDGTNLSVIMAPCGSADYTLTVTIR